ncbi:MAG: hypothetical protein R2710_04290 [Acidimicrobiales bacterium]
MITISTRRPSRAGPSRRVAAAGFVGAAHDGGRSPDAFTERLVVDAADAVVSPVA